MSKTAMIPSIAPLARYLPSAEEASDKVNLPLVSSSCSFFPVSTLYRFTFPAWLPDTTCLESGEKRTVQASTGPFSIVATFSPLSVFHTQSPISVLPNFDHVINSSSNNQLFLIIGRRRTHGIFSIKRLLPHSPPVARPDAIVVGVLPVERPREHFSLKKCYQAG